MKRIDGVDYFTVAEVLEAATVHRQTLYRWRKEGCVPQGHLLRGKTLLFTQSEYDAILAYATRIDPVDPVADPDQPDLFRNNGDRSP